MKAKKGTRYINERTKLETVIPLDTPFVLFIDPSSVCNLSCSFCPCGNAHKDLWNRDKKINIMSIDLFKKIIDDAKLFKGRIKTLRLYKEGEPLVNPNLPVMIKYARDNDIADTIDFTTNGTLLNPELNIKLIKAGISRINISVEALDEQGYLDLTGTKVDVKKFKENIEHLYNVKDSCHIFIKILDNSLQGKSEDEFYEMFGNCCDEIAVEHITYCWPEFKLEKPDNYGTNIYGNELKALTVCPHLFYTICVNSDASVSACFVDWNHKLIVGDANKDSIVDIWTNKMMDHMRIENLKGNRCNIPVCCDCGQVKYASIDNIDIYKEKLLEKYLE